MASLHTLTRNVRRADDLARFDTQSPLGLQVMMAAQGLARAKGPPVQDLNIDPRRSLLVHRLHRDPYCSKGPRWIPATEIMYRSGLGTYALIDTLQEDDDRCQSVAGALYRSW